MPILDSYKLAKANQAINAITPVFDETYLHLITQLHVL